jgi:hypothetical protein
MPVLTLLTQGYTMITDHDKRERRCPRLGHDVPFSYCRKPGDETPCSRIYDCWWEIFDIAAYLQEHYSDETIRKINEPPKLKTTSLLEMIQQAEKRLNNQK